MMSYVEKYPRTPHLPFSPTVSKDDKRLDSVDHLLGLPLCITEKLDGSNVCLTSDNVFARSHSAAPTHGSFDMLKAFHAVVRGQLPEGLSYFGEWCYAVHSIRYERLDNYLNIFGIRDDDTGEWFSWGDVEEFSRDLKVPTVPVVDYGIVFNSADDMQDYFGQFGLRSMYGPDAEGYVVRKCCAFKNFAESVAKWVRAGHVQTDQHWLAKEIERNGLK